MDLVQEARPKAIKLLYGMWYNVFEEKKFSLKN